MQRPGFIVDKLGTSLNTTIVRWYAQMRRMSNRRVLVISSYIRYSGHSRPMFLMNIMLGFGVLIMFSLLITEYLRPAPSADVFTKEAEKVYAVSPLNPGSFPKYNRYASEFTRRHLFRAATGKAVKRTESSTNGATAEVLNRLKKLSLIGIITGPDPVAVIQHPGLEESVHYKTGDVIMDDFRLTSIDKSGVTISNGTQTHHLKL